MKSTFKSENIHSLNNLENFNASLEICISVVMIKYSELIVKYFNYIKENISCKKKELNNFIMVRGLDTLTHVFVQLLFYTNNLEIAIFHCEKAFYFYVEFVSQISTEEKTYLQLSSRDATNYVYKKTLFDIKPDLKKTVDTQSEETLKKMDCIYIYTNLYKTILYKIINQKSDVTDKKMEFFESITNKLNKLDKLNNSIVNKKYLLLLENIVDFLYYKISDESKFIEIIIGLIKQISKNINLLEIIERKINNDEKCNNYLEETAKKFVDWVVKI